MDERAAIVEGTETCQGELTIEDGSVGNGNTDADGAQARGIKGVSDVQGAQVVGGNGSMVSGGIVGAEVQLGTADDVGTVSRGITTGSRAIVGEGSGAAAAEKGKKPKVRGSRRNVWNGKYEGSE